jgi:hypothetical protein
MKFSIKAEKNSGCTILAESITKDKDAQVSAVQAALLAVLLY